MLAEWWVRVATHPDRVRKTAFAVYRTVALPRADRVRSLLGKIRRNPRKVNGTKSLPK